MARDSVHPASSLDHLVACHDCDALHHVRPLGRHEKALCARCGALLYTGAAGSERALALSLASLICLLLANAFPLLDMRLQGQEQISTIFAGSRELWRLGYQPLALLVLAMSIVLPLVRLGAQLWLLAPLHFGRRARGAALAFRITEALAPWAMTEVYLLGVMVAFVKLADLASIAPGPALYAFVAHIACGTAAAAALDAHLLWQRLEAARP